MTSDKLVVTKQQWSLNVTIKQERPRYDIMRYTKHGLAISVLLIILDQP